jgi:hypothetical protein
MPLPNYIFPDISQTAPLPQTKPTLWEPVPKRQILSHFTHKKLEDRVSQRTWYDNVTYPDEVARSLIKARKRATSSSDPKKR